MEITLKYSSRPKVYAAILFVTALTATFMFLIEPEDPVAYLPGTIISGVFALLMLFRYSKERTRSYKTVVISPKGIKTAEEELVKADTIDHCYLHVCDFFIRGSRGDSIDRSFFRLIVVLKDGAEKRIDLEDYGISLKRAESFHLEVNATPGMPLFKEPVIERL